MSSPGRNDILVEDSTCVVRYNSLGNLWSRAAIAGLQGKTVLSVKRLQKFLRFHAK